MSFSKGFPDNSRFTPVPNLLFGPLLENIDDLLVLKCLLRILGLHFQKKGFPRYLTWDELLADRTLGRVLSAGKSSLNPDAALKNALEKIQQLGVLIHLRLKTPQGIVDVYMPNSQEGRRAAQRLESQQLDVPSDVHGKSQPSPVSRPNIFSQYEENIGIIGHIMAEELKEAERTYPQEWIEEAFREAVVRNKRSWSYIEAILKGWVREGREHGEPGRHSKKVDSREWIRRHGLPRPSG